MSTYFASFFYLFLIFSTLPLECSWLELEKSDSPEKVEPSFKIGLIHGTNESPKLTKTLQGIIKKTGTENNIELMELSPAKDGRTSAGLQILLSSGYELIIVVALDQIEAVTKAAKSHPGVTFILITYTPLSGSSNIIHIDASDKNIEDQIRSHLTELIKPESEKS